MFKTTHKRFNSKGKQASLTGFTSQCKGVFFTLAFVLFASSSVFAQRQMNIRPGSKLVLRGNVALVANNTGINNNGTILPGNSTIYFIGNGDTTQSYIGGISTTNCNNLTINKAAYGAALKSAVTITNVLSVNAGYLYADSNLTLISTAANTARVAPVTAGSDILGKAFVQRFIPSRRAWRLLTAPVTSSNTIYDTWQNSGIYTVGAGTYITSPIHTVANGMDASPQNNYSCYTFNGGTQAFNVLTNTKTPISAGSSGSADNTGYFLFVRGDRDPINVYVPNTNITTITGTGKIQTGDQTFAAVGVSGQFTLIGNPYASPIDFNLVNRTNLVKRFYAWDPTLSTYGAFVVMDDIDDDGVYDKTIPSSGQTNFIQSTQAFFVQAITSGASLTINEAAKASVNNNLVFRPSTPLPKLGANLYLLNADTAIVADGCFEQFDNRFSDSVNLDDAKKIGNTNENLGLLRYGVTLSIERRPDIKATDTIFLKLTGTTRRNYQFKFVAENIIHPELIALLQDKYLNSSTPIDLTATTTVSFTVNADAASSNANRFMIVFNPASTVPVTFTTVKAYKQNTGIAVEWHVENETGISQYVVEKSTDGKNFSTAGTLAATGNGNAAASSYKWLDAVAADGNNFYRIRSISSNGQAHYSETVKVTLAGDAHFISVYPNPIQNNTVNIQFNNQPAGNYSIELVNNEGQAVYKNTLNLTGSNFTEALLIKQLLSKQVYQLNIDGPANNHTTQKILVQ